MSPGDIVKVTYGKDIEIENTYCTGRWPMCSLRKKVLAKIHRKYRDI